MLHLSDSLKSYPLITNKKINLERIAVVMKAIFIFSETVRFEKTLMVSRGKIVESVSNLSHLFLATVRIKEQDRAAFYGVL